MGDADGGRVSVGGVEAGGCGVGGRWSGRWGGILNDPHSECLVSADATVEGACWSAYLWALVATIFATVWARVECGLTWKTG